MNDARRPNALITEPSLYLRQHAYNPVNWLPWTEEAFSAARSRNCPLIISIGYSSCHWCHVMEKKSFENEEVAEYMNEHFVCIKIDREERPDLDQVYMDAVQLISGRGGWPLNVFALPDGRTFYGGTYFPPEQWLRLMQQINDLWLNEQSRCVYYADELDRGMRRQSLLPPSDSSNSDLLALLAEVKRNFDRLHGGNTRVPKFPMPDQWRSWLHYAIIAGDTDLIEHIEFTLNEMNSGGIYDQLGGGYFRYSTDAIWKAPHFEKMLYDNALMLTWNAEMIGYRTSPDAASNIRQTVAFLMEEMMGADQLFYSSVDADSEGVEGKFYTWTDGDFEGLPPEEYRLARSVFSIGEQSRWEGEGHILMRRGDWKEKREQLDLGEKEFLSLYERLCNSLRQIRSKRIPPVTDTKIIASWNAMMITALVCVSEALNDKLYLNQAELVFDSFCNQLTERDEILHLARGVQTNQVGAFLDDYAFAIEACIHLYASTYKESYLLRAENWANYVISHFSDSDSALFFFTSDQAENKLMRKKEYQDNVIPSSNAVMACNLFYLAAYLGNEHYGERSLAMLNEVRPLMQEHPEWFSRWVKLEVYHTLPFPEIVITGNEAVAIAGELKKAIPQGILLPAVRPSESSLSPVREKADHQELKLYICYNKSCLAPVASLEEALKLISQ